MDIDLQALQQTALHVVAVTAVIDRTPPHFHLVPIPVQDTALVVGAAAEAPVLAAAGRVGRHQDRL